MNEEEEDNPVAAYALTTAVLLLVACVMCFCLMCCAKCPECRRRRREQEEKARLLSHCQKIKFSRDSAGNVTSSETCSVCLEDFQERETIMVCPCKHGFHKSCISAWVSRSPSCPVCISPISGKSSLTASEATPLLSH